MSSMTKPPPPAATAADDDEPSKLPIKAIPGECGIPILSPIKDRFNYYYSQGQVRFFQSRIDKYGSTVFRCNMPPGPPIASNPRVICVLDAKSFRVLFDTTKIEKKDVLTGTFMPSTSLTGGHRVCAYLDPSEPNHAKIKQLILNLIASRKSFIIPAFQSAYSKLLDEMESQVGSPSKSSDFNSLNENSAFEFVGNAFFGVPPPDSLASKALKWILFQLSPLMAPGLLPSFLEDFLLHSFRLPSFLVEPDYKALCSYFSSAAAGPILDDPDKLLGLSRDEACHNLLFTAVFNAFGGFMFFFPAVLKWLAKSGPALHAKLADEVRSVVGAEGGKVTVPAVEKMELTRSFVYEVLRMDPPVPSQYGRAKEDLIIESHDAAYEVKKGEMIFGYQPFATRDNKVFGDGHEFVADRFVGEKGKALLKYVVWSNGPETEGPAVGNKQCAGKEIVVLLGRLLVVELFLRYNTFTANAGEDLGTKVTVTSLTKADTSTATY